jgi:hypothetical protein
MILAKQLIFLLFCCFIDLCASQCVIQDETCECLTDFDFTVYSVRCWSNTTQHTSTVFPSGDILSLLQTYPSIILELYIHYKNYQSIPAYAFRHMSISLLDLAANNISKIDVNALAGSQGLVTLILNENHITELSFLRNSCQSLVDFHVAANRIKILNARMRFRDTIKCVKLATKP